MRHPDPHGPPGRTPIEVGEVWVNPVTRERATILERTSDNPEGRAHRGAGRSRWRACDAFGYPFTTGAAVVFSFAFLLGAIAADTRNSLYGFLLLIASYPIYHLTRKNTVRIRSLGQVVTASAEIE